MILIKGGYQEHQTWRADGICPCLTSSMGVGVYPDYLIVAMRGRPNKVPHKNIQQLEPRFDGYTNTITSVQKDNLVLERWCLNGISRFLETERTNV